MIRRIVSAIKKWVSGHPTRTAAQETGHLGERDFQSQRDPRPDPGQAKTSDQLDEDTANEVVVTWNLLNPP